MTAFLIGALIGAITGGTIVARRGGNKKDIAQYAAGYAVFFGFIVMFAWIMLLRQSV